MAKLNKTTKVPVKGNNLAPNLNGFGGGYFDTSGDTISVETAVVCNRVVLITTLPDTPEAGAYVALVSVTGELSRVAWVEDPNGLLGKHRIKKAVKLMLKFEKDGVQPVSIEVEQPKSKDDVPPSAPPPIKPTPTDPVTSGPAAAPVTPEVPVTAVKTEVYKPAEAPKPSEPEVVVPAPAVPEVPTEPKSPTEVPEVPELPAVTEAVEEPAVEPEPEMDKPADAKKSSGKMSLKDIANEDKVAKQKNKYRPGKNSRAQQLVESQRVMQQMKHART